MSYSYDSSNGRLTKKHVVLPTGEWADLTPSYDSLSRVEAVTTPAAKCCCAPAAGLAPLPPSPSSATAKPAISSDATRPTDVFRRCFS